MRIALPLLLLLCLGALPARGGEADRFEAFRRTASLGLEPLLVHVFTVDSLLERIDRLPDGESIALDIDGDGRDDVLAWHEGRTRVAGFDEDGDFREGDRRPDIDNDVYLADLNGDGSPDRLVDYIDLDGDGDADRQDLYEITRGPLGAPGVAVTVVLDLDDDNRLFHTTDYTYHANRDQWQSDFDGNVCFLAARRDEATDVWTSAYENPFCFYDNDGDGWSDEALRLEGEDLLVQSLRWSFDLDRDAPRNQDRDYDFSLTAVGPVRAPAALADSLTLRDGGIVRFVAWDRARDLARWGLWRSILLVWDEDDHNVAPTSSDPDRERWEGVIAEAYRGFPPIGGPSCGRINKRYELDRDGSGRLQLYWSDVDQRIHLVGAESGELRIELPGDRALHRSILMEDADANGFFDSWSWTAGGGPDRTRQLRLRDEAVRPLALDSDSLLEFWSHALPQARNRTKWDFEQLERSLRWAETAPVRAWWLEARERNEPLAVRAETSLEAERFLWDLLLLEMGGGFLARDPESAEPAASCRLELDTGRGCSIEIPVARLPEKVRREITRTAIVELVVPGLRISGQGEDLDRDGAIERLYFPPFPTDPPVQTTLEIQPASPLRRIERVRVDPFFGIGIAFESSPIAYRTYNGIIDLFVKNRERLILRRDLGDIHRPQPWGIDALIVGDGPGIGGLYVARDGGWFPLFGPGTLRSQRVLAEGPLRAAVEVSLQAGRQRATRTYTLSGGEALLVERLQIDGDEAGTFAVSLPPLAGGGLLDDGATIWSFGPSAPGAGPIGLAGTLLPPHEPAFLTIEGGPALRFRAEPGELLRFLWIGGGATYGDTTAAAWMHRAGRLLQGFSCSPPLPQSFSKP